LFVGVGLPFAEVLSAQDIVQAFAAEAVTFGGMAKAVFTPAVTLWAFLSQVLQADKSCRAAVRRVCAWRVAEGLTPCSENTGDYCRARGQLPAAVLRRLTLQTGNRLEQAVPANWLWHGRHVKLVDGTTVTLPDTPANQQAYPQPPCQKPGLGFPMIRLVVLLSLASAAVQGMAAGPYAGKETGETALLRQLLDELSAGDVLLADRYYCTYWLVALAQARGVDVVFRMHHQRHYDFRRGRRRGPNDHLVRWRKPQRPDWMDRATYQALPAELVVREVRYRVTTPGFRVSKLVLVTTLTSARHYAVEELADLYHDRWHAELDIRAIKTTLRMQRLRCLSPALVEKELWAHFLGYNLVRKVSAQAALDQGRHPREVSFTASQQAVNASWSQLSHAPAAEAIRQAQAFLTTLGQVLVGQRPDRCEPRAVKPPPTEHKRLRRPRAAARAALLNKRRRSRS
jgi:hypothetical protein